MKEITTENELVSALNDVETFVLFYASWCPFCHDFLPIFEKYVGHNVNLRSVRVKLDDYSNPMWENYNIDVVPTVLNILNGKVSGRLDGILGAGLTEKALITCSWIILSPGLFSVGN